MSRPPSEPGGLTRVLFVRVSAALDDKLERLVESDPQRRSKAAIVRDILASQIDPHCAHPRCRTQTRRVNDNLCSACRGRSC